MNDALLTIESATNQLRTSDVPSALENRAQTAVRAADSMLSHYDALEATAPEIATQNPPENEQNEPPDRSASENESLPGTVVENISTGESPRALSLAT